MERKRKKINNAEEIMDALVESKCGRIKTHKTIFYG
jgi:hypothetical protein